MIGRRVITKPIEWVALVFDSHLEKEGIVMKKRLVLSALLCAPVLLFSQPGFAQPYDHPLFEPADNYDVHNPGDNPNPNAIAMGDLDGDACLDLAAANHDADNVSVFLNTKEGAACTGSFVL